MPDNPEELFDVVDGLDRVTGQARRAEVHAGGLLHRAVHILVERTGGEIFLQKRSGGKDCHPGLWDASASGHLESGEGYREAAVRELGEELGIKGGDPSEIGKLAASERTGQEFVRIFRLLYDGDLAPDPDEIAGGRWVSPAGLDRWLKERPGDFAPAFHEVWKAVGGQFSGSRAS
ncbi:MAG: NUDIX domain-containing protein [Oceanipulchritudo sp.]